jgi:putative ABC transport system ATP-binding protein
VAVVSVAVVSEAVSAVPVVAWAAVAGDVTMPAEHPVIAVRDIAKIYGEGATEVRALRGVSLDVARGEYLAIMGASGSGKSTLMHIIGCLDVATAGRYFLDGMDVSKLDEFALSVVRNRKIGFVFQSFNLIPRTSAFANVELPMVYANVPKAERRERALAALQKVGLGNRGDAMPNQLSGGQQQRVAIARAIVTNPAIILADEPTGALDSESTGEVLELFAGLNAEGRTVVVITHEPDVAARVRRLIRLRDGLVIEDVRQASVVAGFGVATAAGVGGAP